ncbi:hypothetical protein ATO6_11430 [Oceanicola sp. 22II-s10i]|nr:hypothetical protein ATO6_11430 [Oceanicola sp. 22II-s10i]
MDPVSCLIRPYDVVDLATPVAGLMSEVLVEQGDLVAEGDVLARLDAAVEEVELEAAQARADDGTAIAVAEARLAHAETVAGRTRRLADRNAIPGSEADEAEMAASIARSELAAAQLARKIAAIDARAAAERRDRKVLRSPVAGVVVQRAVSAGEYRTGEEPVLTIARIDRLRVEAFVPIAYYPHLARGDVVTILPEPPVGGAYGASITVVDRVFDAASGTVGLIIDLPNPDLALPAGVRCEVQFAPPP